ncbi:hypothetical protein LTR94_033812, partial [Friedmanniomyces endolithicus]
PPDRWRAAHPPGHRRSGAPYRPTSGPWPQRTDADHQRHATDRTCRHAGRCRRVADQCQPGQPRSRPLRPCDARRPDRTGDGRFERRARRRSRDQDQHGRAEGRQRRRNPADAALVRRAG